MTRIVYSLPIAGSNKLKIYLISIHLLALLVAMTLSLHLIWQLSLVLLVLLSFAYYFLRYINTGSGNFICRLDRDADDNWHLHFSDGSRRGPVNLTHCVVTTLATILYFKADNDLRQHKVFISNDAVDEELFRQLRVYCRDVKTFQQ